MVDELERRLAGRHEKRVLRILPTDHCHLGVLSPRDPDVAQPEPQDLAKEDSTEGAAAEERGTTDVGTVSQTSVQSDHDEEETAEDEFGEAEQAEAERRQANRDTTRRPPSSLGFEVVAEPEQGVIELTVTSSFAVYTQHFPTYEEQLQQLGDSDASPGPNVVMEAEGRATRESSRPTFLAPRDRVSLLEVYERRVVEIPPLTFRLRPVSGRQRLTDDGAVQQVLDSVLDSAIAEPGIRREISGSATVPVRVLDTPENFQGYLRRIGSGDPIRPPLRASLDVRVRPVENGSVHVSCYLRNDTPRDPVRRSEDQRHILADVQVRGTLRRGTLRPVELLPIPRDYQYDRSVWAVGHGASAVVDEDRRNVHTRALARYEQPRQTTKAEPVARFEDLVRDPFGTLEKIRRAMTEYAADWQAHVIEENERNLAPDELERCREDLDAFRDEESRFAAGMAALKADERLLRAFVGMNQALQHTSARRGYDRWRLFQIAFIVTQLPALAVREGVTEGEWPEGVLRSWKDALEWADVLWFPTGGGKTEAYLGLISCAALYDRLRGKRFGVTAWLRFPLRMLSVQQLQRAAAVLWETERQRQAILGEESQHSDPISLGYFVGG
ncbi:MAG: hypothetical protein IN808_11620, partial [Rubrobacter sp.]|nr:hypothetical protein [Rubrobacter sp.]